MAPRVSLYDTDLEKFIGEELGVPMGRYISLGTTGRRVRWSDGTTHDEMADFEFEDCANRANVVSEDDISDAAIEGVRRYLRENKEEIMRKVMEAAEDMKQELLAEEPYDGTAGR